MNKVTERYEICLFHKVGPQKVRCTYMQRSHLTHEDDIILILGLNNDL